jgi:exosortase/archaeosortase family protein
VSAWWARAALIFFLPAAELLILRQVTFLGLHLLWGVYGIPLIFFAAAVLLHKVREHLVLSFQPWILAVNLSLLACYLYLIHFFGTRSVNLSSPIPGPVYFFLAGAILASGVLVALRPSRAANLLIFIIKNLLPELTFIFVMMLVHVYSVNLVDALWEKLSGIMTICVFNALRFLGYRMVPADKPYVVEHPLLTGEIYAPCSGLEGATLFVTLYSLLLLLDRRSFSAKTIVVSYLLGPLYMLSLNALRITLYFIAGIWAVERWGAAEGTKLFVELFHGNVGWVIYWIGILAYFAVFYRFFRKKGPAKAF